ncbi:MAG: iron-containing alcohol dehydrogenase [Proteobacteria bacterium]|nr:iron-containing alcohol dehydrogenase [Pseudomonadota bacterium]
MSTTNQLKKFITPEVVFGTGAMKQVGSFVKKLNGKKVLVVSDAGVKQAGWTQKVINLLEREGIRNTVFLNVTPNPKEFEVLLGVEHYLREKCDTIVTIGGGSVTDCGKGIGVVVNNKRSILSYEGADLVNSPIPPMICIPTTSGTSADVSVFCIITNTQIRSKIVITSDHVLPNVTLLDPATLTTMDNYLTACTGMDALVHAIEAYVSTNSSPLTDIHALHAIDLISSNLLKVLQDPDDLELRAKVMLGSLEAGMAFSNANLGDVHAMAHSLGGFLDLPHGECNAMLLNHVMEFNYSVVPERFLEIGKALGLDLRGLNGRGIKGEIMRSIENLRVKAGIKETLCAKGVKYGDISDLAKRAITDICVTTNPRVTNRRDLEVIYEYSM